MSSTQDPAEFQGDALANWQMLATLAGVHTARNRARMRAASPHRRPPRHRSTAPPAAAPRLDPRDEQGLSPPRIVSIDMPSGLHEEGESVRAPKPLSPLPRQLEQALHP